MRTGRLLLLLVTALGLVGIPAVATPLHPRDRVVSASRQFIVYGQDPLLAARVCARGENLKRAFHRLLQVQEQWRQPVFILLGEPAAPGQAEGTVSLQTVLFEGQLRYQISSRAPHDEEALARALLEALCREQANRNLAWQPGQPLQGAVVPAWLSTGLFEVLEERHAELLPLLQQASTSPQPLALESILTTAATPPTAAEQRLFRAQAWLLVDSLLLLPKGAPRLHQFLTACLPGVELLQGFERSYQADLGEGATREKWWALQLARKQGVQLAQTLDANETTRELAPILELHLAPPKAGSTNITQFIDLAQHREQDWFAAVWTDKARRLQVLRVRAHPLYVPVIDAYLEALRHLPQGSPRRFRAAAQRAAQQQRAVAERVARIQAWLDQVEGVHGPVDPAILDRYRAIVERPRPPRPVTPISEYLDRFDR